jgi:hypothetical protein
MTKLNIDKEFIELYNKGLNDSEIARILLVNHVSIKNTRERLNLSSNFRYKRKFDTEEFKNLYLKNLNDIEISKILKVSKSAIQEYRKSLNLKTNYLNYEIKSLSKEQEQIIIGGLLGDSHFTKDKYTNANTRGEFVHCLKQKEYCIWKRNFIKEYCSEIKESYQIDKRTNKRYDKVICRILTNPVFNPYYNLFYKDKVKFISEEMLYRLNGLGLAVWYMDDGTKHCKTYSLATNCFSKPDLDLIQKFFLEKFNIKTSTHNSNVLYILTPSAQTFKTLIEPYIIDSMKYKL